MAVLIRLVAAGFALLLAVLVAFYVYIDVIAGAAIEKGATYALGVDTDVGFVRIGLATGSFRIGSLAIDNPPGFEERHLLRLGDGRLEVGIESLRQDVVDIPVFALADIDVDLEKARGQTNYGVILANLKRFESSLSGSARAEPEDAGSAKRFIVRDLLMSDISARVEHTEGIGDLGSIEVTVPRIRLRNIGARNARGVTLSELTNIIVKAVFEAIAAHGVNLPGVLAAELRAGLGGLADVPIEVVGGASEALAGKLARPAAEAARQLGSEVEKKALRGLGDLFGGRKGAE